MSHHNRFLSEEILTPYKEALSVYPASLSPERLYDISEEQQRAAQETAQSAGRLEEGPEKS